MDTITFSIDGKSIEAEEGSTILDAALEAGIYVPHLCHHPDLPSLGGCRLCVVEIEGMSGPVPSCVTQVAEGMVVITSSEPLLRARRMAMELILASHPSDCGTCSKYLNCELQSLKQYFAIEELRVRHRNRLLPVNSSNPLFVHDPNKCIACGRCVRACRDLRGVGVLYYTKKNQETCISTGADLPLGEAGCRFCGACAEVCPTGAIQDHDALVKGKNRKAALIPCKHTCPAEIDVPGYIRYIKDKNFAAAAAVIREKVPFPLTLGYVCDHPCEEVCRRGEVNTPVSIRELKRFAAEHDDETWQDSIDFKPASGKRVSVIGSGPAGFTVAFYLALQGHEVTVFEALPLAGGMLRYGIPDYRLPKQVIDREIEEMKRIGVTIITSKKIDLPENLLREGFDAVFVAAGTHAGQKLRLPGNDGDGVYVGTDLLRSVNSGERPSIGNKVIVIGGGNVAFDCARVARRLGAVEVHIACLECRAEMPAATDEICQGETEGVTVHPSHTATRIIRQNGAISGVEFLDVASFGFDDEKQVQLEVVEDSHHVIEADTVIFAIGQRPDLPEGFGLETGAGGCIVVDGFSYETSLPGIFAAGDVVTGTSSVIKAIAGGRKAAAAMDRYLEGDGYIETRLIAPAPLRKYLGCEPGFAQKEREEAACTCPATPEGNFETVVCGLNDEAAVHEAERCLQCDLRFKIKPVKFWGDY